MTKTPHDSFSEVRQDICACEELFEALHALPKHLYIELQDPGSYTVIVRQRSTGYAVAATIVDAFEPPVCTVDGVQPATEENPNG